MNNLYYKINLTNLVHGLILVVIILTPLFSFQESISLIFGGTIDNSTPLTLPYVKGIKDLFFIFIIMTSVLLIFKKKKINNIELSILSVISILILLPAFYNHNNIMIFFLGIRWLMPFVLVAFLINLVNINILKKISHILYWLFAMHFILQIFQLFFASYFGLNSLGLSIRNPGIFFIPSTAAIFSIIVLFFSKFYMEKKKEKIISFFIPISIFLTTSGTGIAIYIIFLGIYYLKKKYFIIMPLLLVLLSIVFVFTIDMLSGRNALIERSFGPRIIMLGDAIHNSTLFANNFGYGANVVSLMVHKYGLDLEIIGTDSWYASAVINLGQINSFLLILLLLYIYIILIIKKNKEKLLFFIIYCLFGATTVITESFPANIIFAILLAYYIKPQKVAT